MSDSLLTYVVGRLNQRASQSEPDGVLVLIAALVVVFAVSNWLFQALVGRVHSVLASMHALGTHMTATYPAVVGAVLLVSAAVWTSSTDEKGTAQAAARYAGLSVVGLGVMLAFGSVVGDDAAGWELLFALPGFLGLVVWLGAWAAAAVACSRLSGRLGFVTGAASSAGVFGSVWLFLFGLGDVTIGGVLLFSLPYVAAFAAWLVSDIVGTDTATRSRPR